MTATEVPDESPRDLLAKLVTLGSTGLAVLVIGGAIVVRPLILAKRTLIRGRLAPGVVLVDTARTEDPERLALRAAIGYDLPGIWLIAMPSWIRTKLALPERELPVERGLRWFAVVHVQRGNEWAARALIRLRAATLRLLTVVAPDDHAVEATGKRKTSVRAARWPRWTVAAALEPDGGFRADIAADLALLAGASGRVVARIAVIDTPFDGPEDLDVRVVHPPWDPDLDDPPAPLPPANEHGAIVCSLIRRACPPASIELLPALAFRGRDVDSSAVAHALRDLSERDDVDVVNLSLAVLRPLNPRQSRQQLHDLVETIRASSSSRETIVVAATGNMPRGGRMRLPARLPGTLAVGCVDAVGQHWPDSCGGAQIGPEPYRWVVARGENLTYSGASGTSFASAFVTGLIAVGISNGESPIGSATSVLGRARSDVPGYDQETHGLGMVTS